MIEGVSRRTLKRAGMSKGDLRRQSAVAGAGGVGGSVSLTVGGAPAAAEDAEMPGGSGRCRCRPGPTVT